MVMTAIHSACKHWKLLPYKFQNLFYAQTAFVACFLYRFVCLVLFAWFLLFDPSANLVLDLNRFFHFSFSPVFLYFLFALVAFPVSKIDFFLWSCLICQDILAATLLSRIMNWQINRTLFVFLWGHCAYLSVFESFLSESHCFTFGFVSCTLSPPLFVLSFSFISRCL